MRVVGEMKSVRSAVVRRWLLQLAALGAVVLLAGCGGSGGGGAKAPTSKAPPSTTSTTSSSTASGAPTASTATPAKTSTVNHAKAPGAAGIPTRSRYVVKANGVCRRLTRQIAKSSSNANTLPVKLREGAQAEERANAELRAIGLPKRASKVPLRFLQQRERATAATQALLKAKPGSRANRVANRAAHRARESARRIAKRYGLRDCASR